jgi:hypothetical protein
MQFPCPPHTPNALCVPRCETVGQTWGVDNRNQSNQIRNQSNQIQKAPTKSKKHQQDPTTHDPQTHDQQAHTLFLPVQTRTSLADGTLTAGQTLGAFISRAVVEAVVAIHTAVKRSTFAHRQHRGGGGGGGKERQQRGGAGGGGGVVGHVASARTAKRPAARAHARAGCGHARAGQTRRRSVFVVLRFNVSVGTTVLVAGGVDSAVAARDEHRVFGHVARGINQLQIIFGFRFGQTWGKEMCRDQQRETRASASAGASAGAGA